MDELPVVVIGAGPIGLAAAAHLLERGLTPLVLERGPHAGSAVAQWSHVRLFSPWSELVDPAGERLVKSQGWSQPSAAAYPTGDEWLSLYLRPLAAALGTQVWFNSEVVGLARRDHDRALDTGRDTEPFVVHVHVEGNELRITARAVIDASGTWFTPNPLGADGLPAVGERAAQERICYRVPDLSDAHSQSRYAGKHVAIAGSGHSALTALVAFAEFARQHPRTRISWLVRRPSAEYVFGSEKTDQLSARGDLEARARQAVNSGLIEMVAGFRAHAVEKGSDGRLAIVSSNGSRVVSVDEIVTLTGFRPDLSWLSEVRLELDTRVQAPVNLVPLIDPNLHSCRSVIAHGVEKLSHPEPNIFLVGMKSYGRAPTFLAMTGYEQVRSIAAALAGDVAVGRGDENLANLGACAGESG